MTAMRLKRYPSPSGGIALGKVGVGATLLKQGKTARDYVQDGLIAMWDGIENAGWGVHDANATMWKDLVGGNNATLASDASFLTDSLSAPSGGCPIQSTINPAIIRTIEIIFVINAGSVVFGYGGAGVTYRKGVVWDGTGIHTCAQDNTNNLRLPYSRGSLMSVAITKSGTWTTDAVYKDGVLTSGLSTVNTTIQVGSGFGGTANNGRVIVYAHRVYSRALTASEIAANYAIDKERFNLP